MNKQQRSDPIYIQVRTVRGTASRIARALGISREAVWNWQRVPADRVLDIEKLMNIPRHLIRPDIYPPPYDPRTRRWIRNGRRPNNRRTTNGESRRQQEHV